MLAGVPAPGATMSGDLTRLLAEAAGRDDAWQAILPIVHEELRSLAQAQMARERAGHTLQATALVHEAWMRLAGSEAGAAAFETRRHFFGAAARAMQRVLTDHARRVLADKRGSGRERMTLSGVDLAAGEDPEHALELSDALERLQGEDERAAEITRLRLYAGLEVSQIAQALSISERTVAREWAYGRARLAQWLGSDAP